MSLQRREFLKWGAISSSFGVFTSIAKPSSASMKHFGEGLEKMTENVLPITNDERIARIEKARKLMHENQIGAILLDSGTSLSYFTGIHWWPSERTMVAILPADGEIIYVSPAFEANRLRELISIGREVKTWEEHESPYELIVKTLVESGIGNGKLGMDERLRFFIYDGVRQVSPDFQFVSADPVTIPCRMIKSPAEIALLQTANEITLSAIQYTAGQLREGMSNQDVSGLIDEAQKRLGGNSDGALVTIGEASTLPHGSVKPQHLNKGRYPSDGLRMHCRRIYLRYYPHHSFWSPAQPKAKRDLEHREKSTGSGICSGPYRRS
jgi:Xaa-Pro dipeptidase